jgi:hypothetical protein
VIGVAGRHRLSDRVWEGPGHRFALAVAASIVLPLICTAAISTAAISAASISTGEADTGGSPAVGSGCSGPRDRAHLTVATCVVALALAGVIAALTNNDVIQQTHVVPAGVTCR